MKSICTIKSRGCWFVLCSFLLVIFLTTPLFAEWEADKRLTHSNGQAEIGYYSNGWNIASIDKVVHVVWTVRKDDHGEVYYKRSIDGGLTWGSDICLTEDAAHSFQPAIAVSGSNVHVVWCDRRDGNIEIYYKRSLDGGVSWGVDFRLTYDDAKSSTPCIAVSGSIIHVVWTDWRDNGVYYKQSTDGGVTWGSDMLLSNTLLDPTPSLAVSGSDVHVVWFDDREAFDGIYGIYYKRSTDGGLTWDADLRLTEDQSFPFFPSIAASESDVHVVWMDNRCAMGGYIYYKRSQDNGTTWGNDTRLSTDAAGAWCPSIAVSRSNIHLVWADERHVQGGGINAEIYYKLSTNGGFTWGPDTRLTNNFAPSHDPSIAVSDSKVHVIWEDLRPGNSEIFYKRNPSGNFMCDLDIYNNEADLHENLMVFDLRDLPVVHLKPPVEYPVEDSLRRRIRHYEYTGRLVWPYQNNSIQHVKKFRIVNTNEDCNPDSDGPSTDELLQNLRYRFVPLQAITQHSPLLQVLSDAEGVIEIPSVLRRGLPQTGTITLILKKKDLLLESTQKENWSKKINPGIYDFKFIVEGTGSQSEEVVSDYFIVRFIIGDVW